MIDILFLTFFVAASSSRLSSLLDFLLRDIGITLSDRILTKIIWLFCYGILVITITRLLIIKKKIGFRQFLNDLTASDYLKSSIWIVVSAIISFLFAYNKSQSIQGVFYYAILISIPYLLVKFSGKAFISKFYKTLFVVNILLFVLAFIQYLAFSKYGANNSIVTLFSKGGFMPIDFFTIVSSTSSSLRPSSLLVDPNIGSGFFALTAVFSLHILFKKEYKSILAWLSLISSFGFIVLAQSRTGIISLAAGLVTYALFAFLWREKTKVSAFSGVPLFQGFWERIQKGLSLKDPSSQLHISLIKEAFKVFEKYPLFGIGVGSYSSYYQANVDITATSANPHSAYLRILAEMGIFGAFAYLLFGFYLVKKLFNSKSALGVGLFMALLAGNIFYDYIMTPWVWFIVGIVLIEDPRVKSQYPIKTKE